MDLALALGGRTVEEWKEIMTCEELVKWNQYREIYGPLNPMLRIDAAIARAAAPWVAKDDRKHLMPWPKEPEREATPEDLMNILRMAKVPEKK